MAGDVKRLKFRGLAAMQLQQKQREEYARGAVQAAFEARRLQQQEKHRNDAALLIQKVFRGHRKRRKIARFLRDRRAFFALREKQRVYRENALYHLLQFFGIAPKLQSDTPLERVLKMYPTYMHLILAECVDYQWGLACELWRAQEQHYKLRREGKRPKSLTEHALAYMALRTAKRRLKTAEADLFSANIEHAAAEAELEEV
jgi:hypothetical protein